MNRTDDDPQTETAVMATAFSTMRKYGMNILTATQNMNINAYVKSDPRMPRTRLRRYLGQYGLRGEALSREVRRIVAGPERRDSTLQEGDLLYVALWLGACGFHASDEAHFSRKAHPSPDDF